LKRPEIPVALLPPVDIEGPRIRLGLVWAVVSLFGVALGPVTTSLVFAGVALAASGQACRTWRDKDRKTARPYRPVAVVGATVCALAGSAGPFAVVAAAGCTAVAGLAASQLRWGRRDWDARTTIAVALLIGVGAASPAVIRDQLGPVPALAFLSWVHAIDASTFIVGAGAGSRWEGPVAGAASAGAVGLAVAAVLVPPFRGASPWIFAAVTAALVPAGVMAAGAVLGRDEAPVPGLRRLDAYLVVGPVWALLGRLLLDLA
jgi:hypothetical protein